MFLERPLGLMALLDEESLFPRATDMSLGEKMLPPPHSHTLHTRRKNLPVPALSVVYVDVLVRPYAAPQDVCILTFAASSLARATGISCQVCAQLWQTRSICAQPSRGRCFHR